MVSREARESTPSIDPALADQVCTCALRKICEELNPGLEYSTRQCQEAVLEAQNSNAPALRELAQKGCGIVIQSTFEFATDPTRGAR